MDTFCQARAGCHQNGTLPTAPDAQDLAAGKTKGVSQTSGACTQDCALAGFANQSEAGSDCQTRNGTCEGDSTGRRATDTTPAPKNQTPAQAAKASKDNGSASSSARCKANTVGCDTTTTVRAGFDQSTGRRGWLTQLLFGNNTDNTEDTTGSPTTPTAPAAEATVRCAQGATGCEGNTSTNTGANTENTTTTPKKPAVAADPATGQAAVPATPAKTNTDQRTHTGSAACQVTGGDCTSSSGLGENNNSENDATLSYVNVTCDQAKGCSGKGNTATQAKITAGQDGKTATRTTAARHQCTVGATTGGCSTDSSSTVANNNTGLADNTDIELASTGTPSTGTQQPKKTADPVAELAQGLSATSKTIATINCGSADCTGSETGATSGKAAGDVKAKDSTGATGCQVHGIGGTCGSAADSEVSYRGAQAGPDGKPQPAGVVSVSHADAQVRCTDSQVCGGKAHTATSALDTAVSKDRRGSSTDADCTVTNGGCQGQVSSDASTTTDYVKLDPKTGKPLKGQPGSGPTSTSRASASVDCQSVNCSGTAHTASASFDGAVDDGKPRTSEANARCAGGASSCQVQTLSTAYTSPGAATTYGGGTVNSSRLGSGPSAASTVGGKMTCPAGGNCGGISISATATNPTISPTPVGNKADGSCTGLTGGSCTAVVNAAASSAPDANSIAPMVQDQPTDNASITNTPTGGTNTDNNTGNSASGTGGKNGKTGGANTTASPQGQSQPGQGGQNPTQPATAPGSAASSGGPTVPGASAWSSAWASLNCGGNTSACKGTPHSSATGLSPDSHNTSGTGNRGPPQADGNTTASCDTTGGACQATTSTTAGSGQVVADILNAQNKDQAQQADRQAAQAKQAAEQAKQAATAPGATAKQRKAADDAAKTAEQAAQAAADAKKPLPKDKIPAVWSESTSTARCAGPDCTATAVGKATLADGGAASGGSSARATCSSHTSDGCGVAATSTVSTAALSGQPASSDKDAKDLPGSSGTLRTSASLDCPAAGCTGQVSGDATGKAAVTKSDNTKSGQGGSGGSTQSDARGKAACTGQADCQVGITSSSVLSMADDAKAGQSGSVSSAVQVSCQAGGKGCPSEASSTSTAKTDTAHATSRATCADSAANGCTAGTVGMVTDSMTQVSAQCMGSGCVTDLSGAANAHGGNGASSVSKASSDSHCAAGSGGSCSGMVRAGATETSAMTGASCSGEGGKCSYRFSASSTGGSDSGGNHAAADAHCGTSGSDGGGWCGTTASAQTTSNSAVAAAGCQGSANAGCSYHYSARSGASAPGAQASADGHGGGKTGTGHVMTMAQAQGGGGGASASSACEGSAGTTCHHSYSASASASAKDPKTGSHAEAYAHGSGGGGMGSGGVAVAASAFAKGNAAGASASCSGAANCTAHHSAVAVDHKKIDGGDGYWEATHEVPCGGSGNGGCVVVSNAVPGPAGDATGGKKGEDYCSADCGKPTGSNTFHKYTTVGSANLVPGMSNA
ncbi:MAG: hypothetical protein J2P32_03130, partial [Actinobacteria bacterium]|nr:hypothetical protein [Actinomycetota bacterium]